MPRWPIVGELAGGQRQLGAVEERLQGIVSDAVNLFVGHAGLPGKGHQVLVPTRCAFDNRKLERPQDFAAGLAGVVFGGFHGSPDYLAWRGPALHLAGKKYLYG